jgi:F-type H+-transporting ATPase subunit delta
VSAQAQPQHYARAIYEIALETWTRQLNDIQNAIRGDAGLHRALLDQGTGVNQRLELLERTTRGGLDPNVRKFLGTLLDAGDIDQLDAIIGELRQLGRRGAARKTARVVSAVPLTAAEQSALREKVTRRFGPDLEFTFDVDPGVIGGILLRVGDQVIDGTVAAKLAALRDRLAA